jgi:amidase
MSGLTNEGVVTRSVRDLATTLDAVHGPGPGDPYAAPTPERPYSDEVGADPGKLRISAMDGPMASGLDVDPIVFEAVREAAALLEELGHSVDDDVLVIPEGGPMDPIENFVTRWGAGQAAQMAQFAMLLGREIEEGEVEPLTWAMAQQGRSVSGADYLGAVGVHQVVGRMFGAWHAEGHDLLLTPTMGEPPTPLGTFDDSGPDPLRAIERARKTAGYTALFNGTGQPAISLPLHWTEDGLPRRSAARTC